MSFAVEAHSLKILVQVTAIAEEAIEDAAIATYQSVGQQISATKAHIYICRYNQHRFYSIAEGFSFCTRSNEIVD